MFPITPKKEKPLENVPNNTKKEKPSENVPNNVINATLASQQDHRRVEMNAANHRNNSKDLCPRRDIILSQIRHAPTSITILL